MTCSGRDLLLNTFHLESSGQQRGAPEGWCPTSSLHGVDHDLLLSRFETLYWNLRKTLPDYRGNCEYSRLSSNSTGSETGKETEREREREREKYTGIL
jgi:hypothetical protein